MAVTERIAQLLPEAQEFLAEEKKMLIGGKWVDAASGETFATIDPARDEEARVQPRDPPQAGGPRVPEGGRRHGLPLLLALPSLSALLLIRPAPRPLPLGPGPGVTV